jgi:hypothetical protein
VAKPKLPPILIVKFFKLDPAHENYNEVEKPSVP